MRGNKVLHKIDAWGGAVLILLLAPFKFFRARQELDVPQKFLFVLTGAVGETYLLIPTINSLKKSLPNCQIDVLVTNQNAGCFKNSPLVSHIHVFSVRDIALYPWYFFKLIRFIRKQKYDCVVDAEKWIKLTAVIVFLSGAKKTIGFEYLNFRRHFLFDEAITFKTNEHVSANFLKLIKQYNTHVGMEVADWISPESTQFIKDFFKKEKIGAEEFKLIVHPASGPLQYYGSRRMFPVLKWFELVDRLIATYPKIRIFITGIPSEKEIIDQFRLRYRERIFVFDDIELDQALALIKLSNLVLCGNTGFMHMAAFLKKDLVALHGAVDPILYGPINANSVVIKSTIKCAPCLTIGNEYKCEYYGVPISECMNVIPIQQVYEAASNFIERMYRAAS